MMVPHIVCASASDVRAACAAAIARRRVLLTRSPAPPAPPASPRPKPEPEPLPIVVLAIYAPAPLPLPPKRRVTAPDVIAAVAAHYHVKTGEILGTSRQRIHTDPRHVAMWILRQRGMTLTEIARRTSTAGRDHTSVLAATRRVDGAAHLRMAAETIHAALEEKMAAPRDGGARG